MDKKMIHDQTNRHIINVPIPFTREQLELLVSHFNGWEDDPELVKGYVNRIMNDGAMDLNPSSATGDGANVVDIFNWGFMALMKLHFNKDIDPGILWFHPCRLKIPTRINTIEANEESVIIMSNETVIYSTIDAKTGQIVNANDLNNAHTDNDNPE